MQSQQTFKSAYMIAKCSFYILGTPLYVKTRRHILLAMSQTKTRAPRERKAPPMLKFETKVIWNPNPDFQINPDVSRICPKMFWMHYVVGVSHVAKYGTDRPLIV